MSVFETLFVVENTHTHTYTTHIQVRSSHGRRLSTTGILRAVLWLPGFHLPILLSMKRRPAIQSTTAYEREVSRKNSLLEPRCSATCASWCACAHARRLRPPTAAPVDTTRHGVRSFQLLLVLTGADTDSTAKIHTTVRSEQDVVMGRMPQTRAVDLLQLNS